MANKWVLVLGASGDIGFAICCKLLENNCNLYVHYNSKRDRLNELLHLAKTNYPKAEIILIQADLRHQEALKKIEQALFTIDAVVFAQGQSVVNLLVDTSHEVLEELWHIHIQMPMQLISSLQTKLSRQRDGRIVMISSVYGQKGAANEVAYSTVKGAINAFVHAYAKEVASIGISINAVAPGAIDTKMNAHLTSEEKELLISEIPMQRLGHVDEIAALVLTLLELPTNYLTGQVLTIDGGWY